MTVWNKWQIKYDRLYNREFDNSKIESVRGKHDYKSTFEGLGKCLEEFISNPVWLGMNARYEAWCGRQCGEWTPLRDILGKKHKLIYIIEFLEVHDNVYHPNCILTRQSVHK